MLEKFDLGLIEEIHPVIRPALADGVPSARARLIIVLVNSRHVDFAVKVHIDIHLAEKLLILNPQIVQHPVSQGPLNIQPVFHSLSDVLFVFDHVRAAGDRQVDPAVLVRPGRQICEDLGLAAASLAPKKSASVESFPGALGDTDSPHVFGPPVMVATLVIIGQIHFVIDLVSVLELLEVGWQILFKKLHLQAADMFWNLCEVMHLKTLFVEYFSDLSQHFEDDVLSLFFTAEVRPHGLVVKLLD